MFRISSALRCIASQTGRRLAARSTAAALAAAFCLPSASAALVLTDIAVFSTNEQGNIWESLIWNTRGKPEDVPDRFNLYVSTSTDPNTPALLNDQNNALTRVAITLSPEGTYTFGLYGNTAGRELPAALHYVINLYFNDGSVASISGLDGATCPGVCAASHPNGMNLYGASGTPEAGTLTAVIGDTQVTLTGFDWSTNAVSGLNKVWRYWGDDAPYGLGGDGNDHFGTFSVAVASVPLPWTPLLLGIGVLAMGGVSRMRYRRTA